MPTVQEVNTFIDGYISPILFKHNAKEIARYPDAHLNAQPGTVFTVLSFEKDGKTMHLNQSQIGKTLDLHALLRHWDRVNKLVEQLDKIESPFYSDINGHINNEFSKSVHTQLIYSYICDRIRESGKRIWS